MSDADALLRTVIENPDDDAPRLVYADWLDEHRQSARAEFIRLQCAVARGARECAERADELQALHRDEWLGELPQLPGVNWQPFFGRGFATSVEFRDIQAFKYGADAVFTAAPVHSACVSKVVNLQVEALLDSPHVGRLQALSFLYSRVGPIGAFALSAAPRLRGLRHLMLASNGVHDEGALFLARSASLSGLESLVLTGNSIGIEGGRALAHSPFFSRALKLYVRDNPIDADTLSRLRERFPRLVT